MCHVDTTVGGHCWTRYAHSLENLQKVKYSTPGHMGTKGQSWIRTQERPPQGLSLAHTTRLSPWTAWHTCQQLGTRKPEVCAAPQVGGLEPGQAFAAEGAGVRMGTGSQGTLFYLPCLPSGFLGV